MTAGDGGVEIWVFPPDGRQIAVVERDAPSLVPGTAVRMEGLWLVVTEESRGHWSVQCEAFGLQLDDPDDAFGVPIPVGLDLEWEDDPEPEDCRVSGQVLVGDATYEVDGRGQRVM